MASIWDSTRRIKVEVFTKGPDGQEDQFAIETSREIYAIAKAARLHAEEHDCCSLDVQTRIGQITTL